jgi:hypothetical protein
LYSGWPVSYKNTYSRTFSVNSSTIPYCTPGKSVYITQLPAARRGLEWSAASARLLFDGDNAMLRNTAGKPARRGHRSQPAFRVVGLLEEGGEGEIFGWLSYWDLDPERLDRVRWGLTRQSNHLGCGHRDRVGWKGGGGDARGVSLLINTVICLNANKRKASVRID